MVTFEPRDLQQRIAAALDTLEDLIYHDWYRINEEDFDPLESDEKVTLDTKVDRCRLTSDEWSSPPPRVTVGDLLTWVDALGRFTLRDRTSLRLDEETLIHVQPLGADEAALARAVRDGQVRVSAEITIDGALYNTELVTGFTLFAVLVEAQGENDEQLPAYFDTSTYLRIQHPRGASDALIQELARSLLFELATTAGRVFSIQSYPRIEYWNNEDSEDNEDVEHHSGIELRPIQVSAGLGDLHELFLAGSAANPAQYALIHFLKVIEYVSATVVRLERHDALRRRLSGRTALHPDATFLDGLAVLIEEQRVFSRDAEALRLAMQTCCDPVILAVHAPSVSRNLPQFRRATIPRARGRRSTN